MTSLLLAASAFAVGCQSVAQSVPTRAPVMVGPIDRLGGVATPNDESASDASEFDRDNENSFFLCVNTLVPTVSVVRPNAPAVAQSVETAYAGYAGQAKLRTMVPRVKRIGVGSYVFFLAGCYSDKSWWNVDGHVEARR